MNDLAQIVSSLGFPIFVAVWMLYKSSNDNEKMTQAINELTKTVAVLTNEFKHHTIDGENNGKN